MARTIGPLNSLLASGQIGKAIIYETLNGKTYAKEYGKPTKPLSSLQIEHRRQFSILSSFWKYLSDNQRAAWVLQAEKVKITGYGLFIEENWGRFQRGEYLLSEPEIEGQRGKLVFRPYSFSSLVFKPEALQG